MKTFLFGRSSLRLWLRSKRLTAVFFLAGSMILARGQIKYTTPYSFTTLAGAVSAGSVDGPGSSARFDAPSGIAVDATGNIYVGDTANGTIRKISPGGTVTTLAGKAGAPYVPHVSLDGTGSDAWFGDPAGMVVDSSGTVLVVEDNALRKVTSSGIVTTLSGSLTGSSELNSPRAVALDAAGNIYIADTYNNAIRRAAPTGGALTLVAGGAFGSADGTGSAAQFYNPSGIAVGPAGEIYVADTWNHTIRKISAGGIVTTIAGSAGVKGSVDGSGTAARFSFPAGLAVDGSGNIYVADSGNDQIRKVTPTGVVTTIAGRAGIENHADGAVADALFNLPQALALDSMGNLLVADTRNNAIRKITSGGVVSTVAGLAPSQTRGTADGLGGAARFNLPTGICLGRDGALYVADRGNASVRKVTPAGLVSTYSNGVTASGNQKFSLPLNLTMTATGALYVADNSVVWRVAPDGTITSFFEKLYEPSGCAFDSKGNLIVADSHDYVIRKIAPDGTDTILAGVGAQRGYANGPGSVARFSYMGSLAIDATDTIFLAEYGNNVIRKITADGVVSTVAGTSSYGAVDGPGNSAQFQGPWGLALDPAGNIFVTEYGNTIRRITPAGEVSTVAGSPGVAATVDGVGSAAHFEALGGVAVDASGVLYVVSGGPGASVIRKGALAGAPVISAQPVSQTVVAGSNVQFAVTAGGDPAPTYQWYLNGSVFAGATASTLSLPSARAGDAGDYTVVVTNSLGAVASSKATLTVSATTPPAPEPASSSSGGGGGGTMAAWFGSVLGVLGAIRFGAFNRRIRRWRETAFIFRRLAQTD